MSSDLARDKTATPLVAWLALTTLAAAGMTALDTVLLERKKGFLTGGFLAEDYLTSLSQFLTFISISMVADAAIVGILVLLGLWIFASLRPSIRYSATLAIAMMPLIVADFVSYQLLAYLGDAFDLSLMYELADGRSSELFAVAAGPLTVPVLTLAGVVASVLAAIWMLHRRNSLRVPADISFRLGDLRLPVGLFLAGVAMTGSLSAADDAVENGLRRKPSATVLNYLGRQLSDFDGDGYPAIGRLADPAPFDSRVFPFAVDVPGNGVDEDGVAGDLPAGLPPYVESRGEAPRWSHRPNVVLIMLESFRGDLVGSSHKGRAVTPTLDALAAQGISASFAYSHNGYTVQSRHHVFSGTVANLGDRLTLVDDFKANGYEVAWVSGQDESFGAAELKVGFDRADLAYDARTERHRRYSTFTTPGSLAVPYNVVVERIGTFLTSRTADRPLLLYVNFHDSHFPYHHGLIKPLVNNTVISRHEIAPNRATELQAMYANTAANIDAAIAEVLRVAANALGKPPAVLVIGDHGESLFDENFLGHGYALNDAQTRIPFIAANLPIVIEEPFGQSDLRAALRAALGRSTEGSANERPVVRRDPDKFVFQYLGTLDRPRQIAFVTSADRVLYDMRMNKARISSGNWDRIENMAPAARDRVVELVHYWERMKLARVDRSGQKGRSRGRRFPWISS